MEVETFLLGAIVYVEVGTFVLGNIMCVNVGTFFFAVHRGISRLQNDKQDTKCAHHITLRHVRISVYTVLFLGGHAI